MEIDDILKYLIIMLFLLPGLLGKKKKKDNNRQPPPYEQQYEYEDPFKDFKTFENDNVFSESDFEKTQNPAQVQTEYQYLDSIPSTHEEEGISVFTQSQIQAALASIDKHESANSAIEQNEIKGYEADAEISDDNEFLNNFDIRQAVIYSEILSPKYSG